MKKTIPFTKEIPFQTRIAEITDIEVSHTLEKTPLNTIEGNFLIHGTYKMHEASKVEETFHESLPFTIEVDDKYDLSDVKIKIHDFYFEIMNEDILKITIEIELSEITEKENIEQEILEELEESEKEEEREELEEEQERMEEEEEEIEEQEEVEVPEEVQEEVQEKVQEETEEEQRCFDEEEIEEKEEEPEMKEEILEAEPIDILEQVQEEKLEVDESPKEMGTSKISQLFSNANDEEDTFSSYYVYIVRENDVLESILEKYGITKEEFLQYNDPNDFKLASKLILPCTKKNES